MNNRRNEISRRRFLKATSLAATGGLLLGSNALSWAAANETAPDAIYFNGKIVTLDAAGSTVGGVACKDGKILAVGAADEIKKLAGSSTQMIDLGGKTVVPGLVDGHCHPMETIYLKEDWVDCRYPGTRSVKQALENIAEWAKKTPKGAWIYVACVSATENKFLEKRLPSKAELDVVAPDNPVLLANGAHQAVVNSQALRMVGIKKGMGKLPHGGTVILDKDGEPTGSLEDVQADIPTNPSLAELEHYYTKGIQEFWNQHGFTSLLAITPAAALPVLQKVAESGIKPTIRYTTSVWTSSNGADMPDDLSKFHMPKGADPAWYRFGGIKAWVDGENDARTGYTCDPYVGHFESDAPGGHGTLVTPQREANRFAALADNAGVMCMLHCSGDKAVTIGLNAYDELIKSGQPKAIIRIEHFGMFQLTDPQLKRAKEMKKNGFHVSTQPVWLLELVKADYENMGAKRASTGFQFRSLIDAGLEPTASTDMTGIYLGNINPFEAMYAMVNRESDRGLFMPDQAISVTEALKMWTIWAAKSIGEDNVKGSIEPGKFADMTVLSDDIFTIPKNNLKDVKASKTIVDGKIVYEAK